MCSMSVLSLIILRIKLIEATPLHNTINRKQHQAHNKSKSHHHFMMSKKNWSEMFSGFFFSPSFCCLTLRFERCVSVECVSRVTEPNRTEQNVFQHCTNDRPRNLQQLLLCATQSLFTCDTQQAGHAQANGSSPTSIQVWGEIYGLSNHFTIPPIGLLAVL